MLKRPGTIARFVVKRFTLQQGPDVCLQTEQGLAVAGACLTALLLPAQGLCTTGTGCKAI
jgi:hypothetical protein